MLEVFLLPLVALVQDCDAIDMDRIAKVLNERYTFWEKVEMLFQRYLKELKEFIVKSPGLSLTLFLLGLLVILSITGRRR